MKKDHNRFFGLDFLRTFAIFLVVLYHSGEMLEGVISFDFLGRIPFFGSDVFFVLSGFLIGGQTLKIIDRHGGFQIKQFLDFYQRRMIRILPNYYLFLLIHVLIIYLGWGPGTLNKYFISFIPLLQSFHKPYDFLMWESWSLCVESSFYFFLPFLLFLFFKFSPCKNNVKTIFPIVIATFIIFSGIMKNTNGDVEFTYIEWDLYIRKLSIMRFDSIALGLLCAYLHHYHKRLWRRISAPSLVLAIILLIGISDFSYQNNKLLFNTYSLILSSLGISLLIPILTQWNPRFRPEVFAFISQRAFSLYLLNLPLSYILKHFWHPETSIEISLRYAVYLSLLFGLAHLNYKHYEFPLMRIRNRVSKRIYPNK
jgi:peptidoglycan/LPS O-acetylase OafA/YrhL